MLRPSTARRSLCVLLACAVAALAQPQQDNAEQDNPPQRIVLTERSAESELEAQYVRLKFRRDEPTPDYNLADESFMHWVPSGYDGSEPFGLLVWVSPSPEGWPRRDWLDVMDRHKLIWIAANNAGNPRPVLHRFGLALDARSHALAQYHIDPDRIYIGGMSGGSRVASRMGLIWADLFNGVLMNDGVDFYTPIRVPDKDNAMWPAKFHPPTADVLTRARRENRYVLVTGENDGNRDQTLATYTTGYKRIGFRHVTYFEVPGKGHALIDAEWFEKAVVELDKPLTEAADEPAASDDAPAKRSPPPPEDREDAARRLYQLGVNYLNADRPDLAMPCFQQVVDDFSDTTYAERAEQQLAN